MIDYDEPGESVIPSTVVAQAVLLESDNRTTLQRDTTKVQRSSAASLKPPPPQNASAQGPGGDVLQFKDQVRSVPPERRVQLEP
jgi:hypothetical protein